MECETHGAAAAVAEIDDALTLAGETGEHWSDAELHRIRAKTWLTQGDPAPAEASFLSAIAIAQEQGARSFQLLAALSLARLAIANDQPVEARDVLSAALEGFTPTPELPAIAEAQALLAELLI